METLIAEYEALEQESLAIMGRELDGIATPADRERKNAIQERQREIGDQLLSA